MKPWRQDAGTRHRAAALLGVVIAFNLAAWGAAFAVFHDRPATLGVAVLIYSLGLRHAIDADHIAAIDNVTRKLLQGGRRSVAVGFYFAVGHSAVVTILAVAVGYAATVLVGVKAIEGIAGGISTAASALFLLAIAVINIAIFHSVWRTYRHVRVGGTFDEADLDLLLGARGPMSRLLRPLFRLITRSWHMLPLGFVFGLGFDTATEVTMFSLSDSQATHGTSLVALLVLPALFAAGMSLIDTLDGIVMLGAYEWAVLQPMRRLKYNLVITLASAILALATGVIVLIGFCCDNLGLTGRHWGFVAALQDDFDALGIAVVTIFVVAWGPLLPSLPPRPRSRITDRRTSQRACLLARPAAMTRRCRHHPRQIANSAATEAPASEAHGRQQPQDQRRRVSKPPHRPHPPKPRHKTHHRKHDQTGSDQYAHKCQRGW